jgi:phospholipid/cholesterol/gamma-HCH transport system ATP-binding protein
MSEEKDTATMAAEQLMADAGHHDGSTEDLRGVVPQLQPTPGLPERRGVRRRMDRLMSILHTLPPAARESIIESLTPEDQHRYNVRPHMMAHATVPSGRTPRPRPPPQPRERVQGDLTDPDIAQVPQSEWRPPEQGQGGGV